MFLFHITHTYMESHCSHTHLPPLSLHTSPTHNTSVLFYDNCQETIDNIVDNRNHTYVNSVTYLDKGKHLIYPRYDIKARAVSIQLSIVSESSNEGFPGVIQYIEHRCRLRRRWVFFSSDFGITLTEDQPNCRSNFPFTSRWH